MHSYKDEFMAAAFHEARIALNEGEVPVGSVLAFKNQWIISRGHNETNNGKSALRHAELVSIEKLSAKLDSCDSKLLDWLTLHNKKYKHIENVLKDCVLYVTVEPCIMCASAIRILGMGHTFYGCMNERFGGNGTTISMHSLKGKDEMLQNIPKSIFSFDQYLSECVGGDRFRESVELLKEFYRGENLAAPEEKRILKSSAD